METNEKKLKKIEKMISSYNKTAKKWGYSEISLKDGKIVGEFIPKSEETGRGFINFFKSCHIAGQNASMKADLEKIKKLL